MLLVDAYNARHRLRKPKRNQNRRGPIANIIIKRPNSFGKTRSEQEINLRKEWGPTMTDAQLSKLKYIERKRKEKFGKAGNFTGLEEVDATKV
jgi:hypothetical protein